MPYHGDRFRACWPAFLLLLSGCGVAAYESKMLEAQARMKRFEDESALLDKDPLVIPQQEKKDGSKAPIANVFLRPPLGIGIQAANEADPRLRLFFTYRPRQGTAAGPVAFVELAVGNHKDFAADVMRCYSSAEKPSTRQRQVPGSGRAGVTTFETTEFDDGQFFYSVNLWRGEGDKAAAIVYGINRNQRGLAANFVELSLGTFAVNEEADRQRARRGKTAPQPPGHK